MNGPWKEEYEVWKAYCAVKSNDPNKDKTKFAYLEMRSMKEEYEWFKQGFMAEKGLTCSGSVYVGGGSVS